MSVTKQGDFSRSGPEVTDEVLNKFEYISCLLIFVIPKIEIFRGDENIITLNQTHSKTFHCTYLLHNYPFDTQVGQFV